MLSNNKFLEKCWYGGQPWIRLAMESESMVEKGINFIFCLGTAYDISNMESVGNSKSFSLVGWIHLPKCFYLYVFRFELWHLYKSLLPSTKGLSFTLCNFIFEFESLSSFTKAPTRRHVVNMRVSFMNGSRIEHDGLGITYFSIAILKDMIAC